jgi:hypothetical protein
VGDDDRASTITLAGPPLRPHQRGEQKDCSFVSFFGSRADVEAGRCVRHSARLDSPSRMRAVAICTHAMIYLLPVAQDVVCHAQHRYQT